MIVQAFLEDGHNRDDGEPLNDGSWLIAAFVGSLGLVSFGAISLISLVSKLPGPIGVAVLVLLILGPVLWLGNRSLAFLAIR